jgi:hypothetical protein
VVNHLESRQSKKKDRSNCYEIYFEIECMHDAFVQMLNKIKKQSCFIDVVILDKHTVDVGDKKG